MIEGEGGGHLRLPRRAVLAIGKVEPVIDDHPGGVPLGGIAIDHQQSGAVQIRQIAPRIAVGDREGEAPRAARADPVRNIREIAKVIDRSGIGVGLQLGADQGAGQQQAAKREHLVFVGPGLREDTLAAARRVHGAGTVPPRPVEQGELDRPPDGDSQSL